MMEENEGEEVMAGWSDIWDEIKETPPQFDYVRRHYLKNWANIRKEIPFVIIQVGWVKEVLII